MNFLAHSILSPSDELIMLGNMSGDFVKGSKFEGLHPSVIEGVKIHREIDVFTDNHEIVKEAKDLVREEFRLYSGVVIDMFFDHFVARHLDDLKGHVNKVYTAADFNFDHLPEKFQPVLPYMKKFDWLGNYGHFDGLRKIMWQMRQRIGDKSPLDESVDLLIKNEARLQVLFDEFWREVSREFRF